MRLLFSATALIGTFFLAAAQADPQLPLSPNADLGGPVAADGPARLLKPLGGVEAPSSA